MTILPSASPSMRYSLTPSCAKPIRCNLQAASSCVVLLVLTGALVAEPPSYQGLSTGQYLGEVEVLATVKDTRVFTEGPAWTPDGALLFTNVPVSRILKWDPRRRALSVFRDNTSETNGLYFAPDGSLLACEGRAGRVTRTDPATGRIHVLADGFGGRKLAMPNDLCMDRYGRVYFTSRSSVKNPAGENNKAVYRIDVDGTVHQLLAEPQVHMPNGIVISPSGNRLYLIEAHPDENFNRRINVYDLKPDGTLHKGRTLIDFYPGRSGDGMCIDERGNLYVAAGLHATRGTSETLSTRPGIHVISPEGKLLAFRETPEDTITNCAFGGPDLHQLFVTCGSKLLRIPTKTRGFRLTSDQLLNQLGSDYRLSIAMTTKFPVRTTHGPITGRQAVRVDIDRYVRLLGPELRLYPHQLIKQSGLRKVVLCTDLKFDGQARSAIPDFEHQTLFLDVKRGASDARYQRLVIHHEFFHIVDYVDDGKLNQDAVWSRLNAAKFRYGEGGRAAQNNPTTSVLTTNYPGFLNHYSTTAVEEDKAEVFAHLVVNAEYCRQRAAKDKVLSAKFDRMKLSLNKWCSALDTSFWQRAEMVRRDP